MSENIYQYQEEAFIAGEWQEGPHTIVVSDLVDGEEFARIAAAGESQARAALAAAREARASMRDTTVVERAGWLEAVADEVEDRRESLAEVIVREAGKPISSARGEVDLTAERFRRAAAEVRDRTGEYREESTAGHEGWRAMVKHEPMGTVLCIGPYNYPLSTVAYQVAPALAAGNCAVVKPSSKTPVSSARLVDIVTETVDLPDGALNYVPGRGSEIGDVLAGDERVRHRSRGYRHDHRGVLAPEEYHPVGRARLN
ncbi:MAG: aldehyde dehydrogenase [Haloarculaceae archaeon]